MALGESRSCAGGWSYGRAMTELVEVLTPLVEQIGLSIKPEQQVELPEGGEVIYDNCCGGSIEILTFRSEPDNAKVTIGFTPEMTGAVLRDPQGWIDWQLVDAFERMRAKYFDGLKKDAS